MVAETLARDGDGCQRTSKFARSACVLGPTRLRVEVLEDEIEDVVHLDKGNVSKHCEEGQVDEWGATGGRRKPVQIESIRATLSGTFRGSRPV